MATYDPFSEAKSDVPISEPFDAGITAGITAPDSNNVYQELMGIDTGIIFGVLVGLVLGSFIAEV